MDSEEVKWVPKYKENRLCNWSIELSLVNHIKKILPQGKTILELGSGWGTHVLSEFYTMYSIEDNPYFLNKYKSTYLYAPLKAHKPIHRYKEPAIWYDPSVLEPQLKDLQYDLILIDGPPSSRGGFYKFFYLFNKEVPMVFDDQYVHDDRDDRKLLLDIARLCNKPYTVYHPNPNGPEKKPFGVIL